MLELPPELLLELLPISSLFELLLDLLLELLPVLLLELLEDLLLLEDVPQVGVTEHDIDTSPVHFNGDTSDDHTVMCRMSPKFAGMS